jgi:hypothetical protein
MPTITLSSLGGPCPHAGAGVIYTRSPPTAPSPGVRTMKESSRRWLDAGITLAKNPSAQVLCPQCEAARLTVTDAFAGDCIERWMRCPACGAYNTLLNRGTPRTSSPDAPGWRWRMPANVASTFPFDGPASRRPTRRSPLSRASSIRGVLACRHGDHVRGLARCARYDAAPHTLVYVFPPTSQVDGIPWLACVSGALRPASANHFV